MVQNHPDHIRYPCPYLGFGQPNVQLQNYAALKMLTVLNLPHVTDTLVCVGSYIVS